MSASMSEFAVNVGFESIAGTKDSYKGENDARDSESSNNYITLRHLVDRQRIDMRHMEPEAGNSEDSSQNPVCLLAQRSWGNHEGKPAGK